MPAANPFDVIVTPRDHVCVIHGMRMVAMEHANNGRAIAHAGLIASARNPPKMEPNK